ncbi:MAG TPA: hypothetical protein VL500_06085 [Candidatus Eisenbacteria bacterium]|nr:hypothetical protein [Candidatus Eisenbacteria bacterium]
MPTKLVRASLVGLFSVVCSLLSLTAAHAAVGPGDLVKLQDDGNLETTADSAVYYVGSEGKRYAFPNSQTYFTWYADFNTVKIATPTELAALQLGGNVVYRAGTRMVKITSDPHVYAVEPGGALRWVQTEAVASGLYGADWNKRIDDVPDAFFVNYASGEPLAATVYPNGTVVKRSTDNVYFLIENRNKRKIVSAEVRAALRIQDAFVITTAADLSDYPDGADIVTAEAALTDTAQRTSSIPSIPTFTIRNPATNFFAIGGDASLLELHIASLKAVTVSRLVIKLDATTNNPADPTTDDDKGGLVYQNNAQPNFTQIRFRDAAGAEPFGRKELTLNIAQDQSQTFIFDGSFSVPAGTEKVLYLMAKSNTLLPAGEGYKATLVVAGTSVKDASTGASAVFAPSSDMAGPTLASLNASLEVQSSDAPGSKTYVRGSTGAEIAGLSFKATTVAPNVVTRLTVQGYIDEEGTSGFLPAADADNGTETRVNAMLPTVSLYTASTPTVAGTKLAGPVTVSLEGKATFTGFSYSIPAGATGKLVIKGDIPATLDVENAPNKVTFDVVDASVDVGATDDKGSAIPVKGLNPNGGTNPLFYATVKKIGSATWTWGGTTANAIVGREVLLGTLSVSPKDDSFDLKTLGFRQTGPAAHSLGEIRLEYPTSATTKASVTGQFIGTTATFSNLPIMLERDKNTDLKLYGKIVPKDAGALEGEVIRVQLDATGALQFVSRSNGDSFDAAALAGPDFTVTSNAASALTVRFTGLTFAKDAASPGGAFSRSSTAEVLRFTAKAEPEGPVRLKKLTFKVTPADAGQVGSNNDALERWADVNGDFPDDDGIVNLKKLGGTEALVGEDASTRIMYSIVHSGTKSSESSTLDSAAGDYGLIEYVFDDGNEYFLAANTTYVFSLELDSTMMNSLQDFGLGAELLGGGDLQWTDIPSGTYTAMGGTDALGVPQSGSITVKK